MLDGIHHCVKMVKSHFEAQLGTFQEEEGSELLYAYPLLDKNDNQENDEMTPTQNLLTNCSILLFNFMTIVVR